MFLPNQKPECLPPVKFLNQLHLLRSPSVVRLHSAHLPLLHQILFPNLHRKKSPPDHPQTHLNLLPPDSRFPLLPMSHLLLMRDLCLSLGLHLLLGLYLLMDFYLLLDFYLLRDFHLPQQKTLHLMQPHRMPYSVIPLLWLSYLKKNLLHRQVKFPIHITTTEWIKSVHFFFS